MKRPKNPAAVELPKSAQVIAEVIGREATLKLAKATKNRKLYVPVTMCGGHAVNRCGRASRESKPRCTCRGHWIADVVGDANALKLSQTFGGEVLDLAPCFYVHVLDRNKRMRAEYAAGKTVPQLMADYNLSNRTTRYIIYGWDGRQDRPRSVAPCTPRVGSSPPNPPTRGAKTTPA